MLGSSYAGYIKQEQGKLHLLKHGKIKWTDLK